MLKGCRWRCDLLPRFLLGQLVQLLIASQPIVLALLRSDSPKLSMTAREYSAERYDVVAPDSGGATWMTGI